MFSLAGLLGSLPKHYRFRWLKPNIHCFELGQITWLRIVGYCFWNQFCLVIGLRFQSVMTWLYRWSGVHSIETVVSEIPLPLAIALSLFHSALRFSHWHSPLDCHCCISARQDWLIASHHEDSHWVILRRHFGDWFSLSRARSSIEVVIGQH